MNGAQPLLAQPHAESSVVAVGSSAGDEALRAAAALHTEQQRAASSVLSGTANADPAAAPSKAVDPQSNKRYIEELYCKTPHSQHAHVLLGSEQSQRVRD